MTQDYTPGQSAADDKILDRVRKLLALGNDEAAAENERETAMRMAHAMLTKYQLDMEDVDSHTRDRDDPRGRFDADGWNVAWTRPLRQMIGRLFMAKYVYGGKINATRGRHIFIGRASNATTAMLMSDWIMKGIIKEGEKRYGHRLHPDARSFAIGACDMLRARVEKLIKEAAEQEARDKAGTGRSLVLVDLARSEEEANDAFLAKKPGKRVTTKRDFGEAYVAGSDHGSKINLSKQLGNKKGTLAIK